MTFADFNLHPTLFESLESMGFEKPTPIQEQAIPYIMANRDLIACAQTGTGKTAAYLLPTIHNLLVAPPKEHHINTLVIAPTRELALQIDQQVEGFGYYAPVTSAAVYGGGDGATWDQQKRALVQGADVVIATPGRLLAHMQLGYVDFKNVQHLVLDEADRMLDMGFHDDIMTIVKALPTKRQTLLFSATMPHKIRQLAKHILVNPHEISIAISKPAAGILQAAYFVNDSKKNELVKELLTGKKIASILIFASTKIKVKKLVQDLHRLGFSVAGIHSDLEQAEREKVLSAYRARQVQILVATDILSRGIDMEDIGLVINYDNANSPEDYVHRIGRTARAESTGVAITLVNDLEREDFKRVEQLIGKEIQKLKLPPHLEGGINDRPKKMGGAGGRDRGGRRSFSRR